MRINSYISKGQSGESVWNALQHLTVTTHPMSATGGWFSTELIARTANVSKSSAMLWLAENKTLGVVEQKQHGWRLNDSRR